jgi:hypothetical protein
MVSLRQTISFGNILSVNKGENIDRALGTPILTVVVGKKPE